MRGIIENIGRQLKEALPHAIVNNRPENFLARIMSYRTIQEAHDAGHSWIKIKGNGPNYPYAPVIITNNNVRIEGSHDVIIDSNDVNGIYINGASRCTIKDLKVIKRSDATSATPVKIEGDKNGIYNIYAHNDSSANYGFEFVGTASSNTLMNCVVEKSAGWPFVFLGSNQYNILINIKAYNSGAGVVYFSGTSSRNIVGNAISHDTNAYNYVAQIDGSSNYNVIEGSIADTGNIVGNATGTNYSDTHQTY